jgi:gliding motility-associated-like protein
MIKHLIILSFLFFTVSDILFAQIEVNFESDTTVICEGGSISFADLSVSDTVKNWHWNFGDGGIDSIKNPTHTYLISGVYSVSLTASGSNATQTKVKTNYIFVRKFPTASFSFTDTMFLPSYIFYFHGTVLNRDTLPYKYYWNFNQSSFNIGDSIAVNTFPSFGSFVVSLIIEAGNGCQDTVSDTIQVNDILEVPNVFSPNGDGQNDVFIVKSNGVNDFELVVFNRWGAIVYTQTAKRLQWDGRTSAGVQIPFGTYFYHITSPDVKGYKKSGALLLVK